MILSGTMEVDEKGVLYIGGVSAIDLADEFGTPLLVLDEVEIRNNARRYLEAFRKFYPKSRTAYASKAFINMTLCKIIDEEGLGLDVVSGGELYIALKAGFPPERIYFHGNNKSISELEMGLKANIGRFMVDNIQEALLLNQLSAEREEKVKVILRTTPGIEAHTHEFIQTGHLESKFGVGISNGQALAVIKEILKMDNLELTGIHAHIGSQIFNLTSFVKEVEILMKFMAEVRNETGYILKELDLGGGLGIPYTGDESKPDIAEYARLVSEKINEMADGLDYPLPLVINEPGRSIIGTAGVTLYSIGTIKEIPGMKKYLAVDGGMTDNIRPALYGAEYEASLANRMLEDSKEVVTIAGKCCESGDILIKDIKLPEARPGDILAVSSTGAYTYAMASNYNGLPRPAIVLVKDGKAELITRRESYEDLIRNDTIPQRFQEIGLHS